MKTVYCTIASANYLPRVLHFVESLERHRPGADVRILLCEHPSVARQLSAELGRDLVSLDQIGCPDWRAMAFAYDIVEFNTAVKPFLLQSLLSHGVDSALYFDPDIEIFSDPVELEQLFKTHDCLLTPHVLEPLPEDGKIPSQLQINTVGQFNLGFLGLRRTPEVKRFLTWWSERLTRDCVVDLPNGIFVDQSWANLLVSFVPRCHVLRSQAYNFAYWNAPQRKLTRVDGRWLTADGPLVFFHFSGVTLKDLESVSRHQNRIRAPEGSPLRELLRGYAEALATSRYAPLSTIPYSFDRFLPGGEPIPHELRRRFRALPLGDAQRLGDPFKARGALTALTELNHEPRELDRLRREVEALQGQLAHASTQLAGATSEVQYLREQLGLLRYRMANRLNRTLKKVGVHVPTKKLLVGGEALVEKVQQKLR